MHKLINKQTGETHLCEKVIIDGYDYYVSDFIDKIGVYLNEHGKPVVKYIKDLDEDLIWESIDGKSSACDSKFNFRTVIATNNPNIDIPKVIDEAELRDMLFVLDGQKVYTAYMNDHNSETALGGFLRGCKHGYNKSQETHPNSNEDMIEFAEWCSVNFWVYSINDKIWENSYKRQDEINITTKELLQLWKSQKTKTIYILSFSQS